MKNKTNDLKDSKQKQSAPTDFNLEENNKPDNRTNKAPAPVLGEKQKTIYVNKQT